MATNAERWARKLLDELPAEPRDILRPRKQGRRFYGTPEFLGIFLEWLNQLLWDDPQAALKWAEVAPRLALMVEAPEGHQTNCENLVRSYAILGGANRATGRHEEAEAQYRSALNIVEAEPIGRETRAALLRRVSILRDAQGEPELALELLDVALGAYDEPCLGEWNALVCKARVLEKLGRYPEAIEDCGQVLEQIKVKGPAERRVHYGAVSTLAYTLRSSGSTASCWLALEYVGGAKKLSPRTCAPLYHLEWIEGLSWAQLRTLGVRTGYCLAEEAENALRRAFFGFATLRLPWEIVLVGLDLIELYRDLGKWPAVLEIAIETQSRFQSLHGDGRAVAALGRIVAAAKSRQGIDAAIRGAREIAQPGLKPSKLTRARPSVPPPPIPAARSTTTIALVETRKRFLAAAYREIPRGFQMQRIAKVGSTSTLYKHFGDREGLAVAVVDEHMRGLITAWVARLGDRAPLADVASMEPPLLVPPAPELYDLVREPLECVYREWHTALAKKLERGQQERTVRADIDPASAAGLLLTALCSRKPQDPKALRTACAVLAVPSGSPGSDGGMQVSSEYRARGSIASRQPRRICL